LFFSNLLDPPEEQETKWLTFGHLFSCCGRRAGL